MMFLVGPVIGDDFRDQALAVPHFALDRTTQERACLLDGVLVRPCLDGLGSRETIHAVEEIDPVRDHDTLPPGSESRRFLK